MASLNLMPKQVLVTCSPEELRNLADQMEKTQRVVKLGETTIIGKWYGAGVELLWSFDQEKKVVNEDLDAVEIMNMLSMCSILILRKRYQTESTMKLVEELMKSNQMKFAGHNRITGELVYTKA